MQSFRSLLFLVLTATSLYGCGGGGGGGGGNTEPTDPNPPVEPPPPAVDMYTLSGTVTASKSQAVDSDNNDPARAAVSNDTPVTAQDIPNPITLGGYVNEPETGAEGRSQSMGDLDDFFRVELFAGQRLTLIVADFQQADADLYLLDEQGRVVDFSIEIGEIESITVPNSGTYFIVVNIFEGATNYTLAIGAGGSPQASSAEGYRDIVPWQSVVRYRENAQDQEPLTPGFLDRFAMEQQAGNRKRSRLLAMTRTQGAMDQRRQQLGKTMGKLARFHDASLRARWETLLTIKHLRREPDVASAEPNYILRSMATPDDAAYPFQWHYPLINVPSAWDTTTGDPSVRVAVVDTGILKEHPDLLGQFTDGFDFVSDPVNAGDGDGLDSDPQDPGGFIGGEASSFHGTHVSGTVAARGNNGVGVAGIAYTSLLMPIRALGIDGSGTSYDVHQAIRYAAGLENDSGQLPSKPADIINLSLGGRFASESTRALLREVQEAGVIVVAAAGNEASSLPYYPAAYNTVIAVSAVDAQRSLTPYSNTGTHIAIAAPGGNSSQDLNGDGYPDGVLSTGGASQGGDALSYEYTFLSGTSMSAPHISGILALMKSINSALSPQDIDALISLGQLSDDLGEPGRDNRYGYGLINAQKAILAALESIGSSPAENPRLVASSDTLNFAAGTSTLALTLQNAGSGELSLLELTPSQPWLTLEAVSVDPAGLGQYRVGVERQSLDPGTYGASILAASSVNQLSVQVLMTVGGTDSVADVGRVYVLLIDNETGDTVAQFSNESDEGDYTYELENIEPGSYQLFAGSDADNDLLVCDAGEACGALLTVDQPIVIEVGESQDALDFPIEYLVSLPQVNASSKGADATRKPQSPTSEHGIRRLARP